MWLFTPPNDSAVHRLRPTENVSRVARRGPLGAALMSKAPLQRHLILLGQQRILRPMCKVGAKFRRLKCVLKHSNGDAIAELLIPGRKQFLETIDYERHEVLVPGNVDDMLDPRCEFPGCFESVVNVERPRVGCCERLCQNPGT